MMEHESLAQPFGTVVEEAVFYPEPQRVQCLNFLLHLAPYAEGLLYVSGAAGSGKSTLLARFLAKAADNWRICALDAEQLENLPIFLREIQQAYGFSLHGANDQAARIKVLFEHLGGLQRKGLRPLLLIDNAHRLNAEIADFLNALIEVVLTDKSRLGLILLAEDTLATLGWFEVLKRFGVHSFALTPLSIEETVRYIQHRLQVSGYTAEAIAPAQIKKIYKLAHGNLGQTNQIALALLKPGQMPQPITFEGQLNMTQEEMTSKVKKPIKLSRILFGFLTVLLGLALYFEDEINAYLAPRPPVIEAQKVHKLAVTPQDLERAPPPQISLPEVVEEPVATVPAKEEAIQSDASTQGGSPAKEVSVSEATKPIAETQVAAPQAEEAIAATPAKSEAKALETKPATQPDTLAKTAMVPPQVTQDAASLNAGEVKKESWVMEQNPNHYILQIMAFSQEEGIAKTLEKIPAKGDFVYYQFKKDGKIWYRLAYGIYPDRKAADAAMLKGLPKELGKVNPWVRRISEVQKEITSQ